MSVHSARGLRGLGLLPLRSLFLSLATLGGLLLAPAAGAQEDAGTVVATITDLAPDEGGLRVRILWSDTQSLPTGARLVSYDGKQSVNDSAVLTPRPGQETEVRLAGALKAPWETGWSQKLVLEDSTGEVVLTQPYDVNLDCGTGGDAACALTVTAGADSSPDVLPLSEALDAVITRLEATYPDKEFDLIEQVQAINPRLTGEAYVYAQSLSRLPFAGPCNCVWQRITSRSPGGVGFGINVSNSTGTLSGWNGPGARHSLTAIGGNATGIGTTVSGISQVTLRMSCSRWVIAYRKQVIIIGPFGQRIVILVPYLRYVPCISNCQVRFDHRGQISGSSFVSFTTPNSSASATDQSIYRVNGSPLLNLTASNGTSFNQTSTTSVWSNVGSTGRVDSTGSVRAARTLPYWASASVANGHSIAIHAKSSCSSGPTGHGAVWTYGTLQGSTTPWRTSLQSFFWARGYWILIP